MLTQTLKNRSLIKAFFAFKNGKIGQGLNLIENSVIFAGVFAFIALSLKYTFADFTDGHDYIVPLSATIGALTAKMN